MLVYVVLFSAVTIASDINPTVEVNVFDITYQSTVCKLVPSTMKVSIVRFPVGFIENGIKKFETMKFNGFEAFGVNGIEKGLKRVMSLLTIVHVIKF